MSEREPPFESVGDLQRALQGEAYLADRGLATAIYLALSLDKPLLLEGEAGVGKTEVAKALAAGTSDKTAGEVRSGIIADVAAAGGGA